MNQNFYKQIFFFIIGMDKKLADASSLKVGGYVIIDGVACKVTSIQVSRPGKHGHAKSRIEASGLIDGQKKVIVMPSHDRIEVPIIEKKSAQVLSVSGDVANVMDMETYETFDLKVPLDLKDDVNEGVQVVYWTILGVKVLKKVKN